MDVEHQQGTWTQLRLIEAGEGNVRHGAGRDGGTESEAREERQAFTASIRKRALTDDLMERVCEKENLRRAYKRVRTNQGAPGIDGMTVAELYEWSKEHIEELIATLLEGSYAPQPVKGVEIPKPGGGTRHAPVRDTDSGRPNGATSLSPGSGATAGPDVLRIELRISAGTERARCATSGSGIRG